MRRFVLVFLLAPLLIGFPTSAATASAPQPTYNQVNSFDDVLYWTISNSEGTIACSDDPLKQQPCLAEISLNGRTLEYRSYDDFQKAQNSISTSTTSNPTSKYLTITGSGASFPCWAPTWPTIARRPIVPLNERCLYRQYHASFNGTFPWSTTDLNPRLTVRVRKVKGTHPVSHLGFLHATGHVHEFIPTSDTNEFATLTMSPGFSVGGGHFSTSLQSHPPQPDYAYTSGGWLYGFFLATAKVTGAFENFDNIGFEMLPESRGAWQATNAAVWGFYGEYWKPDYAIRVAGPHFQYKRNPSDPDVLNTAWFTAYLPRALVQRQFGINPEQADETTLNVTRSVGRNPTQLPSTFTVVGDALLIETDGITFSNPAISITRRIVLNKRQRMSVKNIIASAGVPKRLRGKARIAVSPCRKSKKNCSTANGKVTFTKAGQYVFQVDYSTVDARKRPIQRRHQITIRVR